MNLKEKITGMLGKTYMYKAKTFVIENFAVEANKITLVTSGGYFDLPIDKAEASLQEFLPASNELQIINKAQVNMLNAMNSNFNNLNTVLLDNIEKVKNNPAYVPQANAVLDSVKVIADLAKVQLQAIKMMQ